MRAINDYALDALDKGELIALPILVLMLLAIFRSPLAALVPAISGLLVTRVGTALMGLIGRVADIDALALNMVAMLGLALGVDYSLLVVSRFREELANGLQRSRRGRGDGCPRRAHGPVRRHGARDRDADRAADGARLAARLLRARAVRRDRRRRASSRCSRCLRD